MKLAFIADVHVGNHRRFGGPVVAGINTRCRLVIEALTAAVKMAEFENAHALFVLGDLFDGVRPEPQIIAAVQRALRSTRMGVYVLLGNHDQVSTADGDNALGPLAPIGNLIEHDTILTIGPPPQIFAVPFRPGPAAEWLPKVFEETFGGPQPRATLRDGVLVLHLGLSDSETPSYLNGSHDSVPAQLIVELCCKYGFAAAFAGNWHFHKMLHARPFVYQVGCLAPTGFDNPSLHGVGVMMLWDTEAKRAEVVRVPGPRFVKLRYGDPHGLDDSDDKAGCAVFVSITARHEEVQHALAALDGWKAQGLCLDGEVIPDKAEAETVARQAASAASSAVTLDGALVAYVGAMQLEDGVNREVVLQRARHYLGVSS